MELQETIDVVKARNAEQRFFWLGADAHNFFGTDYDQARVEWWAGKLAELENNQD